MLMAFSIVIICRDEEEHIGSCLSAIQGLTDDILIVDTGSTDRTIEIINTYPVRLIVQAWKGYGAMKNYANQKAKHDWIFSLDADEVVDGELYRSLKALQLSTSRLYGLKRINHIGDRQLRYGHLKPEIKARLFNKNSYQWDDKPVHELLTPQVSKGEISVLSGSLLHYQAKDVDDLRLQYEKYATLTPTKRGLVKTLAPYYHFVRSYVFMMGFMEGAIGYQLAQLSKYYRHLQLRS